MSQEKNDANEVSNAVTMANEVKIFGAYGSHGSKHNDYDQYERGLRTRRLKSSRRGEL